MRSVLFLLFLVFGLNNQAVANSGPVVITPHYPVAHCNFRHTRYINQMYGVKIEEDANNLSIRYKTFYYRKCEDDRPLHRRIMGRNPLTFWKEGINWPGTRSPFEQELEYD